MRFPAVMRRTLTPLLVAGGILIFASAAPAAVNPLSHSITVTPSAQSGTAFGGISLQGESSQSYTSYSPPSPVVVSQTTHLDDDFAIDTTGLSTCAAGDLAGKNTADAIAACPSAKIGSGVQDIRVDPPFGLGSIFSTLTFFNGPPSGVNPTVLVHSRFEVVGFTQTFVVSCVLSPSSLGGDFGVQVACATGGAAVTHLSSVFDDYEYAPGHDFLSARCNDPDQTWNVRIVWTYIDTSTQTADASQPCTVADSDADDDGIDDAVDAAPGVASDAFDDGDGTSGAIVDRNGLDVTVADSGSAAPNDGVHVSAGAGSGAATFDACGFTYTVSAEGEADITCASLIANVIKGEVEVLLPEELTTITIPAGVAAEVSDNGDGTFAVENLGGGGVTVTTDGVASTVAPGGSSSVDGVNLPTSKDQCEKAGWNAFHSGTARFKNQGDCVSSVAAGGRNSHSG